MPEAGVRSLAYAGEKQANAEISAAEYSGGALRLRSMPRIVFVELTRFCNLFCPMCREPGSVGREQTMTRNLFERIAEELFPTAEIVDLRGWGESLIMSEFEDRLGSARDYGCEIRVVTN